MKTPITIYVDHADPLMQAGLVATLRQVEHYDVLVPPISPEALRSASICVADYQTGLLLHERGRTAVRPHGAAILIVSSLRRGWHVRAALESGVHGYILQDSTADELLMCVNLLTQGIRYITPAVNSDMASSLSQSSLTSRERDTLQLLAKGHGNKTIASYLGITLNTTKVHVKALMMKLDSRTRTQAVVTAIYRGWILEVVT